MATSVFTGGQKYAGSFRADQLKLQFGGLSDAGYIVQNVQFNYTQQVTMLYEVGSNNVYYVGGRAQGAANVGRILGPRAVAGDFIRTFSDICNPKDIGFDASSGCGTSSTMASAAFILKQAVLVSVGLNVGAQDVTINESLQFMFIDLHS